jgi:hypothetical protein
MSIDACAATTPAGASISAVNRNRIAALSYAWSMADALGRGCDDDNEQIHDE